MRLLLLFFILSSCVLYADSVVLVTGGAQGIGKAICNCFAENGTKVIVADIQEPSFSHALIEWVRCDISQEEEVQNLFDIIKQKHTTLSGVVHNAAIAIYRPLEQYNLAEWDKVNSVNLKGIFLISAQAFPLMKSKRSGWMVLLGSVHSRTTSTHNAPYVATKGAVHSLTRALALEGAPFGIRVNSVAPGAIQTPMLMENWGDMSPENHPLVPRIPLQRIGKPEEIADAVFFLASDKASYITGSELLVDGGLSAHFD